MPLKGRRKEQEFRLAQRKTSDRWSSKPSSVATGSNKTPFRTYNDRDTAQYSREAARKKSISSPSKPLSVATGSNKTALRTYNDRDTEQKSRVAEEKTSDSSPSKASPVAAGKYKDWDKTLDAGDVILWTVDPKKRAGRRSSDGRLSPWEDVSLWKKFNADTYKRRTRLLASTRMDLKLAQPRGFSSKGRRERASLSLVPRNWQ